MDSDANAPDSWDSLDDPGPGEMSEGTSDMNARLHSLNINAKPFVPNVNAPAFVPSFLKTTTTNGKAFPSYLILILSVNLWLIVFSCYDLSMFVVLTLHHCTAVLVF